jgi:hypothetical protein
MKDLVDQDAKSNTVVVEQFTRTESMTTEDVRQTPTAKA